MNCPYFLTMYPHSFSAIKTWRVECEFCVCYTFIFSPLEASVAGDWYKFTRLLYFL